MMLRRILVLAAVLTVPRLALAQTEPALAETLFQDAKALLAKGAFAEACPKLAESQRLDPGDGTLLALAVCHEGEGKLAAAWSEYTAVANKADARPDRVQRAKDRLVEIEPKLARVAVVVPLATSKGAPAIEIVRDGSVLGRAAWGTASPVDPGVHVVEARAPGKKPVRVEVIATRGRIVDVVVPALDDESPRAATPTVAELPAAPAAAAGPSSSRKTFQIGGVTLGGLGVAAIGLGSYFGLRAMSLSRDAKSGCSSDGCSPESLRTNDDAKSAAHVANFAVLGGVAALGGGALLFLLAPKAKTVVTPYAGSGTAGASLSTVF